MEDLGFNTGQPVISSSSAGGR
nr:hypothetical protein [Dickeya zeae]